MSRVAPPDLPPEIPAPEPGEKYLSLLEHLQELRFRVMVCAFAVVIGLGISAYFAKDLISFMQDPAKDRAPGVQFQSLEPMESFVTYFRVALLGGLICGMPVIVYQLLRFVSPGLKPGERVWLYGTVIGATALFLVGVAFAYYVALPPAMDFLLNFNTDLSQPNIRIGSYIDFVTRLVFWIGVSFETPLVIMYLARLRIVRARQLLAWWRYAIVAIAVIAAIVTPTVDPVTMSLVMGPLIVLYFLGILLAVIVQPKRPPAA